MFKVKITKTAEDDIKEAAGWWSENRFQLKQFFGIKMFREQLAR